jgi:hypothetical protein
VGQSHALPESWASAFPVRNKPRPLRRLHKRDQKTAGRSWPCPTRGPVPEMGKLSDIGMASCARVGNPRPLGRLAIGGRLPTCPTPTRLVSSAMLEECNTPARVICRGYSRN